LENKNVQLKSIISSQHLTGQRGLAVRASLLLVFMFALPSFAKATPLQVSAGELKYPLGEYLSYLEIQGGHMTLQSILDNNVISQFKPSEEQIPNFGFTDSTYWFSLSLLGAPATTTRWLLEVGYPVLDQVEFYLRDNQNQWHHQSTGDNQTYQARPIDHRNFVFPIELEPNQATEILIRVTTQSSMQLPLTLWSADEFRRLDQARLLGMGVLYGTLLIMIFYNLFVYFSVRDRSYLHYVAFVTAMLGLTTGLSGIGYQFLWPSWPGVNTFIIPLSVAGIALSANSFTRHFLNTRVNMARWDGVLKFLIGWGFVAAALALIAPYSIAIRVGAALGLPTCVCCLFMSILGMRNGFRPARYYFLSWMSLYIATAFLILSKFGIIPTNEATDNIFNLAITIQVLLASFALGDRIRQLQSDKDKVQSSLLQQYEKYTEAVEQNQALQSELKSHEVEDQLSLSETLRRAFYENQEDFQSTQVLLNQFAECGRMVPGIFNDLQSPINHISTSYESLSEELLALETTLNNDLIAQGAPETALKQLRRSFVHLNNKLEQIDLSIGRMNSISKGVQYFTQGHDQAITGVAIDELLFATKTVVNNSTKGFQVSIDLDKLPKVTCNPGQLCFTFAILLSNAAEALEAVKAEHKDRRAFFDGQIKVTGRLHKNGEQSGILLAVEDNGGGIPREKLETVFEPYSDTQGGSHMGMGLSICKLLVRHNRGNIKATDSSGLGGARIEIFLPA